MAHYKFWSRLTSVPPRCHPFGPSERCPPQRPLFVARIHLSCLCQLCSSFALSLRPPSLLTAVLHHDSVLGLTSPLHLAGVVCCLPLCLFHLHLVLDSPAKDANFQICFAVACSTMTLLRL